MLYLALPLLVFKTSGSAFEAIAAFGVQTLPYLSAPLLGAVVDRYPRRLVFAVSEAWQGVTVALVPVAFMFGEELLAMGLVFAVGVGGVMSGLASDFGLIPNMVSESDLDKATSLYSSLMQMARFLGPALAGVFAAVVAPAGLIEVDAATFVASAVGGLALGTVSANSRVPVNLEFLRAGLRHVMARTDLKALAASLGLYNVGVGGIVSALVIAVTSRLGWSVSDAGGVISAGAVFASLGAFAAHRIGSKSYAHRIVMWLAICLGGAIILVLDPRGALVEGYCLLLAGEGGLNATTLAYRQRTIPGDLTGRANAILRMIVQGSLPVSAALLGWASSYKSPEILFGIVGVCVLGAVLLWGGYVAGPQRRARGPGLPNEPLAEHSG